MDQFPASQEGSNLSAFESSPGTQSPSSKYVQDSESSQQSCADSLSSLESESVDNKSHPKAHHSPSLTESPHHLICVKCSKSTAPNSAGYRRVFGVRDDVELHSELAVLQVEDEVPYGVLIDDRFTTDQPPTFGQCKFVLRALSDASHKRLAAYLELEDKSDDDIARRLTAFPDMVNQVMQERLKSGPRKPDGIELLHGPKNEIFGLGRHFSSWHNLTEGEWAWFSEYLPYHVKEYIRKEARLKLGKWSAKSVPGKEEIISSLLANVFEVITHEPTWMNDLQHLFWMPLHQVDLRYQRREDNRDVLKSMRPLTPPDIDRETKWPIEHLKWDRTYGWNTTSVIAAYLETIPLVLAQTNDRYKTYGLALIHFWKFMKATNLTMCTLQLNKIRYHAQFPSAVTSSKAVDIIEEDMGWGIEVKDKGKATSETEMTVEANPDASELLDDRMDIYEHNDSEMYGNDDQVAQSDQGAVEDEEMEEGGKGYGDEEMVVDGEGYGEEGHERLDYHQGICDQDDRSAPEAYNPKVWEKFCLGTESMGPRAKVALMNLADPEGRLQRFV
ncbi:hypothetical protein B9Z65_7147 [Elsinoe australis]|uniref:Uncharacterized protein n=1 Tax=Elsinoe australis TaxID=40998 RepID=A0A2P7Z607_9PEZI|nr:hypothetical protein B9Z65_7147 [Elsinoe australis]